MKTSRIKFALLALVSAMIQPLLAANDACILTYNKNIWQSSPQSVATKFSNFKWGKTKVGYQSNLPEGLKLWGKDILTASITGASNTESVSFLLYDNSKSKNVSYQTFYKTAAAWKKLLDEKSRRVGKSLPKTRISGKPATIVAWEFPDSVMTLTAVSSSIPNKLYIRIFSKSRGVAYLDSLKNGTATNNKKDKKKKGNVILTALDGKTSYFEKKKFVKRNISGSPDYFLLNFTASW